MHGSIGSLVELLNKCINGGKYRGISRRFTYRGIPFIPVYRATQGQRHGCYEVFYLCIHFFIIVTVKATDSHDDGYVTRNARPASGTARVSTRRRGTRSSLAEMVRTLHRMLRRLHNLEVIAIASLTPRDVRHQAVRPRRGLTATCHSEGGSNDESDDAQVNELRTFEKMKRTEHNDYSRWCTGKRDASEMTLEKNRKRMTNSEESDRRLIRMNEQSARRKACVLCSEIHRSSTECAADRRGH
jgi:hypothetical protein